MALQPAIFKRSLLFIMTGLLFTLLTGCTIKSSLSADDNHHGQAILIEKQSLRTTPEQGSLIIDASHLQVGDILLSRSASAVSLGIRAFTVSSVSHASVYIGNNQVAEAIGTGIQIVPLPEAMDHSLMLAAYRYPDLTEQGKGKIIEFAQRYNGKRYNFAGIVLIAPYTITRNICRLPTLDDEQRNQCLNNLAAIQISNSIGRNQSFFCSQFVLEAFNYANHPITDAKTAAISPDDLMHMREGDVPSVQSKNELLYVGHLKIEERPTISEGESFFPHSFMTN